MRFLNAIPMLVAIVALVSPNLHALACVSHSIVSQNLHSYGTHENVEALPPCHGADENSDETPVSGENGAIQAVDESQCLFCLTQICSEESDYIKELHSRSFSVDELTYVFTGAESLVALSAHLLLPPIRPPPHLLELPPSVLALKNSQSYRAVYLN